jgi:hypothetical protein
MENFDRSLFSSLLEMKWLGKCIIKDLRLKICYLGPVIAGLMHDVDVAGSLTTV